MSDREEERTSQRARQLVHTVGSKETRRIRARRRRGRDVMFWLGMFGLVGWSVAIPTVLGTLLGLWIDRSWPGPYSFTLMGLALGVIVGCATAWYWVRRESERELPEPPEVDGTSEGTGPPPGGDGDARGQEERRTEDRP